MLIGTFIEHSHCKNDNLISVINVRTGSRMLVGQKDTVHSLLTINKTFFAFKCRII